MMTTRSLFELNESMHLNSDEWITFEKEEKNTFSTLKGYQEFANQYPDSYHNYMLQHNIFT